MSSKFETAIRKSFEAFRPQTFAVGVWHDGKEEFHTFGRVSADTRKANADTVFQVASVSKSFIAACVWMLVEEGKIDAASPVTRYLPDFAMYTEELTRNLTVRDAMCHCCGLPRHDITLFTRAGYSLEQMVGIIRYLPPAWALRERFGYSNHMFAVLSLLVERVSGIPWGEFVKKRIFEQLGMSRSFTKCFEYVGADDNYARPRTQVNGRNRPIVPENVDQCGSSGAISASVRDLLQWAKLNLRGGVLPDGSRLYSQEAASQLHGEQTVINVGELMPYNIDEIESLHYGMGWIVERYRGERLVQHGGTISGYKSYIGFLPGKDFAFAALANLSGSPVCDAAGRSMCDVLLEREETDWNDRYLGYMGAAKGRARAMRQGILEPPDGASDTTGLAGRYENKAYGVFAVSESRGKLTLLVEGMPGMKPLSILPSKHFQWAVDIPSSELAMPCRFEKEDGRAVRMLASTDADLPQPMRFERC